jgi:hypothetical protein
MSKAENERQRIQDEFDQIQSENSQFDISQHLAGPEDLPDLGEIVVHDYEADMIVSTQQSIDVLESLVDLYLSDIPKLKDHSYIKNKMREDAMVYADAIFLNKMTKKSFLSQMRQVENGDNAARMHEVVNQTIGQIRENGKFLSTQRTELEKFYKTLRKDLGYHEIENPEVKQAEIESQNSETEDSGGGVMDNRKLNDMIKLAMTKKDEK